MRVSSALIIALLSAYYGTPAYAETGDIVTSSPGHSKAAGEIPPFHHEAWGRCYFGEGYVYGATFWRDSAAVVDIDSDGDDDFVFRPHYMERAVLMRNLGTSGAFYPGGAQDLYITPPDSSTTLDIAMDFEDLTGDGRPDMVATAFGYPGGTRTAYVVWYENGGLSCTYRARIFTGPAGVKDLAVNLADINADGLMDLFIMVPYLDAAERNHRVFLLYNVGTRTSPSWSTPTEVYQLGVLMPPAHVTKAQKSGTVGEDAHDPRTGMEAAKAGYTTRVSDIEIVDWNIDGKLDFMFYDIEHGIDFVLNIGTAQTPVWASSLNSGSAPIPWRHNDLVNFGIPEGHHDDMDVVYGSFAVRTNPGAYLPDAKWLDDFYIDMDGWLITRRWITQDSSYHFIQENALEYGTGQGPAEFWDYDADGDLDLFRSGIGTSSSWSALLLFPNIGTVYAPAWDKKLVIDEPDLHQGTPGNNYHQDLFTFSDHDADGLTHLFVQRQNGVIEQYNAFEAASPGELPFFLLADSNFGDVVFDGQTGISPGGLTIADFNANGEDKKELVVAYHSDQGGLLIWHDPPRTGYSGQTVDFRIRDEGDLWVNENTIQSLAATDLDRDGRIDLIVTFQESENEPCSHVFYRNVDHPEINQFSFDYIGVIAAPQTTDPSAARMISLVDIDADGDDDLFIGHQKYYSSENTRRNYWRFYRNGSDTGLYYWRTRVVENQNWYFYWNGELPEYEFIMNNSGASFDVDFGFYSAGSTSPTVDILQSTNLDENVRIFVDVLPPVSASESKAILLVGGSPSDSLYDTFSELADYAYYVLRTEGLAPENILFFCSRTGLDGDGDGNPDVYGAPTLTALQTAVTSWGADTQRLLVYLIDHGQRDRFRINNTQYLEASTYAGWLETLRNGGPGPQVTTIIDTCEAGSFIDNLELSKDAEKASAQRITIAGSGVGPIEGIALFDKSRYLSFSLSFWGEVFNGGTYGQAFKRASVAINSINPLQVPQIDDDGDGIPNESNDGLLAETARPGADFELPGTGGVIIGQIAPQQVISSSSATLWLSNVYTSFPVEAAGALIVPPNYQRPSLTGDDEQPVTGLQWLDFAYNAAQERWEGTYSGFSEGGLYRIQYYAKAGGRYYASPRIGFVDRIGAPDAWEPDGTYSTANWIPYNSVQGHNFHTSGDTDWTQFTAVNGMKATVAVVSPGYRCQAVVKVYRLADYVANPSVAPVRQATASAPGEELVFEHTFAATGEYLMRVSNSVPAQYGEGTSYLSLLAVGTGSTSGTVPTTLLITVLDDETMAPIPGATVRFDGTVTATTTSDGAAQFLCTEYGSYPVRTTMTGYDDSNETVSVNNLFEQSTILLNKAGTEGEGEGEGCGTLDGDGWRGGPGSSGNAIVLLALCVGLAFAKRRRTAAGRLTR